MAARIIGIGQAAAGDDGVGIAVARRLSTMALPVGIEVVEIVEPSALIDSALFGADPIILIDAIVGDGEPGQVVRFEAGDARAPAGTLLTTHGVGVLEAVKLARELSPEPVARRVYIVGVTIERPKRYGEGLSAAVAAAVEPAIAAALEIARLSL